MRSCSFGRPSRSVSPKWVSKTWWRYGSSSADVVVVAVVPGDPAACAREQRRVEHLTVVVGGMLVRGEVRADAELLEHDRPAEAAGELARERRRQQLADLVVLHRVDVRPDEVDERRELPQRVAVVVARHLDAPGAVAERDRLGRAGGANRLYQDARPGSDLLCRGRPAVERHLVRDEPADDRRVAAEAPRDLRCEPGLLGDEPDVAVEVTALAPHRIPVLAGHVADDERRDRAEAGLDVRVEEVGEPFEHHLVELLRRGHEVGPVAERAGHVAAVLRQHRELLAYDRGVVARPHPRPAGPRPEVRAEPDAHGFASARAVLDRAVGRPHQRSPTPAVHPTVALKPPGR